MVGCWAGGAEKGSGTFCAQHPSGLSGKRFLTPFPLRSRDGAGSCWGLGSGAGVAGWQAIVTVRFYVGEDREDSMVKIYNKLHSNIDAIPPTIMAPSSCKGASASLIDFRMFQPPILD